VLSLYKTRLKGCTELPSAAQVTGDIHDFFSRYPEYLNAINTAFLLKYPVDLHSRVCYAPQQFKPQTLVELKSDVDSLSTRPD
jgi:hypothetical protein